ncbi:hypothetical protein I7I48_09395 [Histoplasma ohiense]|nr:hypothetical protein I7I48_09395 [Histoplasma ohiense (nom. inval.)]
MLKRPYCTQSTKISHSLPWSKETPYSRIRVSSPPIRHPLPVALNGVLHHPRPFRAKGQRHMPLPQGVPLPIPPLTNEATNPPQSGVPPLPPPPMPKHANRPSIRLRRLRYLCHRFPYQTPKPPGDSPGDSPTDPPELQPQRIPISSSSTPSTTSFSTSFSSSCAHAPGAGTTTASIACIPAGTAAARRRDQRALAPTLPWADNQARQGASSRFTKL